MKDYNSNERKREKRKRNEAEQFPIFSRTDKERFFFFIILLVELLISL